MKIKNIIFIVVLLIGMTALVSCSNTIKINPAEGQKLYRGIPPEKKQSVGLCLSGGGYRATIYHLGVLWRLNELGMLPEIGSITAVSGGAILAGHIGLNWSKLDFDEKSGVAINFQEVIAKPVLQATTKTIDTPSVFVGALTPSNASKQLISYLDTNLFCKHRLADFTQKGPEITIKATALQNKQGWWFSREYMGGSYFGVLPSGDASVALAVAASAGYPPFLAPTAIDISGLPGVERAWRERRSQFKYSAEESEYFLKRREKLKEISKNFLLADGGIINNIGSESCLNVDIENASIFSSASAFNGGIESVGKNWISVTLRALDMVYSSKEQYILENIFKDERNKTRTVFSVKLDGTDVKRSLASRKRVFDAIDILSETDGVDAVWAKEISRLWTGMQGDKYIELEKSSYSAMRASSISTRLKGLSKETQIVLLNAGYLMAENSIRKVVHRRFKLDRKAFEIISLARNQPLKTIIEKSMRDLPPQWIPNFWTAVPQYIDLDAYSGPFRSLILV